ncbi:hypothetical protein OC725_02600 ['Bituminaria bituminosa' little leaf phytoplasma]|uniref:Uncharacterized protein n=1 Tax=Candidatus Phytoplasma fabacearum TaxID=2982628 RepID=A0ABU8ZT80_9MOLU
MQSDVNDGSSQGQEINRRVQEGNQNSTVKEFLVYCLVRNLGHPC